MAEERSDVDEMVQSSNVIINESTTEDVEDIEDTVIDRTGPLAWIHSQISNNANPRDILSQLMPGLSIPSHVDDISLWRLVLEILSEPAPRQQLKHISTLDHVKQLLSTCKNIVVLTGAGISVSCGIPDFRSRDGIYARLSQDYPDLPNPQAMFDINYFKTNQWPFFKFAKEIYPGQFTPSLCHRFISFLDQAGILLRNYTQNIDTLEQVAGIKNVVQCHGSFATATCMNCKYKLDCEEIKDDIFNQKIPYCKQCTVDCKDKTSAMNVIKPDIVFFGESLPKSFHNQIQEDKNKADLLIVIGSSLKVRPVSLIPNLIKPDVPQILINREPLSHFSFDVELYGNCDDVIAELCTQLGSDWIKVLEGYKPNSLDKEKLKSFFDYCNSKDVEIIKDGETEGKRKECGENPTEDSGIDSISECSNDSQQTTSYGYKCKCDKETVKYNDKTDIKRKCTCQCIGQSNEGPSPTKRSKKDWRRTEEVENSNEDIYYLSLPPNRYLFHGAELDLTEDDESDYDGSSDEASGVATEQVNENESTEHLSQIDFLTQDSVATSVV